MKRLTVWLTAMLVCWLPSQMKAQFFGTVVDGQTGEAIIGATAKYQGTSIGAISDLEGKFQVPIDQRYEKLELTYVGYKPVTVIVNYGREQQHSTIKMYSDNITLNAVVIKAQGRVRYKRKDNPAVELMRKVIAAKKQNRLELNDFYSYQKYEKHTFSVN